MPQVGRSVPRLEARDKVTGRAEYVYNLRVPGMLYGRIVRSTVAHARSTRIWIALCPARIVMVPDAIPGPMPTPSAHGSVAAE
jgi:CO/xanthine dehydrogenase Mo-binding subunit